MSSFPAPFFSKSTTAPGFSHRKGIIAFSLVELLVVIGVITALLLLALPIQRTMAARSQQTRCVSQLKQLYTVFIHYAGDNGHRLPKAYNSTPYWTNWWNGPLTRYSPGGADSLAQLVTCPVNRKPTVVAATAIKGYPYVVNYNIIRPTAANDPDAHPATPLTSIPHPATTILLMDSKADADWYIGFYDNTAPNGWGRVAAPHLNAANILWCDGHVSHTALDLITVNQIKLPPP